MLLSTAQYGFAYCALRPDRAARIGDAPAFHD